MRAAYATGPRPDDPLAALAVGDRPEPEPAPGWTTVTVRAASLNHHDVFTLRGAGIAADAFPMILGCDAAGVDDEGNDVIVHGVIASPDWTGDETLDPRRSLLSERHQGTLAERVVVPRRNLIAKPAEIGYAEAACLGVAWLTAYRMLFLQSGLRPGDTVLVQGASGGVATAATALARAAGMRVWVTGRTAAKRELAQRLGAHVAFEPGARLPERVDAVIETVGAATWKHSLRALRPGGTVVTAGATTGSADADLTRVFFQQLRIVGSTMGTREELQALTRLLVATGLRPTIARECPLERTADGLAAIVAGDTAGKIVVTV